MEQIILGMGFLIAVLIIAAFIVLRTKIKRIGIKRTCCGGHKKEERKEKVLEEKPIFEVTVRIEDLCCEDCAIRVENAFNRLDGVSAKACHKEKRVVLLLCGEWSEAEIRAVVSDCGFTAGDMQSKAL